VRFVLWAELQEQEAAEQVEWFPEQEIWECGACSSEVAPENIWRSRGLFVSTKGCRRRTTLLRSECPQCGMRQSLCIEGPWWRIVLFHLLWWLRYGAREERPIGGERPAGV
jgi:hypothetical protein